ncbi:MAG TPA: alcohol dehydrogenase catalytic domain-containing protein [Acidimicrobiales bacterium]|nr:alcohol dehydrogenase catalytic domain-containing protein [Acidimicrobiales bacterium]
MRAVTWQGPRDVRVCDVPDPTIEEPTDAIIRVTTSGLCGSDLHLYEPLSAFMEPGDIIGHEPIGIVEALGSAVGNLALGDRVVVPFNIACGHCHLCEQGRYSQCETTQNRAHGTGADLFGYSSLYGQVPGAQAEYLRVPHADFGPVKVPDGPGDQRFVYLSDVLPTAWQAVHYADISEGGSVAVFGLGPIGQMSARIAARLGASRVFGVDLVPERLDMAAAHGVEAIPLTSDLGEVLRGLTDGRGPDAVIDAVGMEAHGAPVTRAVQRFTELLPSAWSAKLLQKAGVDRLSSLHAAIDVVCRGGTVSVVGVYGGAVDPMPMMQLFDKGVTLRMGQANVRRWTDDIMGLLTDDDDPLDVEGLATHVVGLEDAPEMYATFQEKRDGAIKVLFEP